jgi:hypothetical protein
VYDAATGRFSAVWRTVEHEVLNGYYDIRVKVVDEAGNHAYLVTAEQVIVDNTAPVGMVTSIDDDTTLTPEDMGMATDTELIQSSKVVVRATVRDALTSVAAVQFQVKAATLAVGPPLPGNADEINLDALGLTDWVDIGLAVRDDDPEDSYSLLWDTSGLLEGDYLLRVKSYDILCNSKYSGAVRVTVVDNQPPVAAIVGYYPKQMQFLHLLWPKKCDYDLDFIYAITECPDIQEVQIQRSNDPGNPASWVTVGIQAWNIPFEELDTPGDKADDIRDMFKNSLFPMPVTIDKAILEAFDWDGLWGTTWKPMLPDGTYYLRAVAKDWSGNVDASLAPIMPISIVDGAVQPVTPASAISIEFTANLGGTGVGDVVYWSAAQQRFLPSYDNTPSVVLTVEAPEEPTVLVLVEVDSKDGLVFGGEIVDVREVEGAPGTYAAALKGDELAVWIGNQLVPLDNYLTLLRLGGKITAFATTTNGMAMTSLMLDDLRVFRVTHELGTNGTVRSKDGAVSVMVPPAALYEEPAQGTMHAEQAGLMITPSITPNTSKNQRLILEPVGQAYSLELFDYLANLYFGFRPGFEPLITIDYSGAGVPPVDEALGFISVRYWQPSLGGGGSWKNDDIINLKVDEAAKKVTFNLKSFGERVDDYLLPHHIFSIVLEKSLGRIDGIVFDNAFQYSADPDISYVTELDDDVFFRIVDPGGIDDANIRIYIDGELHSVGTQATNPAFSRCRLVRVEDEGNRIYAFDPPGPNLNLTEGYHTLKIEAWDKSDAVDDSAAGDWLMLERTVGFYVDRTPPVVVTHAGQRDGVRYFSNIAGATVSITIVDEGVGINGQEMQNDIYVDVFKHLTEDNTPLRNNDQGNIINYQRKVLVATSKPVLEYCDDYTPDGVDNTETWVGIHDASDVGMHDSASNVRHQAWRASYTIQVGQIDDGDTFEVVFYSEKPNPTIWDDYNENAVYLFEDLTRAYLKVWDGANAEHLEIAGAAGAVTAIAGDDDVTGLAGARVVVVPATQVPDLFKRGLLQVSSQDPWFDYYDDTFLEDQLFNEDDDDEFFVRHLVADTRAPVVSLDVPEGVKADQTMATVSASAVDDASGLDVVQLVINGNVVDEKVGPASNLSVEYSFAKGEAEGVNEIKVVAVDAAGNRKVARGGFDVQETDGPAISDMTPQGGGVADAMPIIAASYSDPSGIDESSVTLTLNGAVIADATVGASKVSYKPTKPLKAGVEYTVKVSVKDAAGNSAEDSWQFALETDAPTITDMTPSGVDETGTPVISAKFDDAGVGVDTASVKLMLDGKVVEAEVGASSVSYTPPAVLKSGTHNVELALADIAGTAVTANNTWSFTVEETPPTIIDVAPTGTINDDMPVLSAKYSDSGTGVDVGSVVLSLDGKIVEAARTDSQASYGVQEPLKAGVSYTVSVTVADKAGNVANSSRIFRLESTGPSISNTSPAGTVQSVDVAVSANYSDAGSGIDQSSALMKVDGVVVPATPSASGISYQATELVAGDHTVYVEVADRFGNSSQRSWSFKVEETPPTISEVKPSGEVSDATPVLSASYSDTGTGIDVSSVVLMLNGNVVPSTKGASQVSYEVLTPLLVGVTYQVTVEVADRAGNTNTLSSTFSLETTPPQITDTDPTGTVSEEEAASGIMISAKLSDDGSGVDAASVVMWLDGDAVDANATVEGVQYMAKGLRYGDHRVRLAVADMLGNTADEEWDFSVADSTPPTLTVISPKQDAVVGVRPVIKISYADEGSGVDLTSVVVKVDGEDVMATAMAPAKPSNANVVSAGEASYEVKLGYGAHTLTVEVKDVAGNPASAEVTFTVEGDALALEKPRNVPNPFRGGDTTIAFGLSQSADVTIRIYDFTARLVATVADGVRTSPNDLVQDFKWDGTASSGEGLANGVYFCQVLVETDSERKSEIIKIALVRD